MGTLFSHEQSATLTGTIAPDGSIDGQIMHQFDFLDSSTLRTFTFSGMIDVGGLNAAGTGSWLPNPMSAVPWGVEISITGGPPTRDR